MQDISKKLFFERVGEKFFWGVDNKKKTGAVGNELFRRHRCVYAGTVFFGGQYVVYERWLRLRFLRSG